MGGRYPESVRWTALLNAGGWKVINKGENGRTIPKLNQEIEAAASTIHRSNAETAVVMLGSNDLLQYPGLTAEVCGKRMKRVLRAVLLQTQREPDILLVAPPSMEPGAWVSDPRTVEESRKLVCCYETTVHRLGIAFADAGVWGVGLTYNGVHFSEDGHLAFAKGMQKHWMICDERVNGGNPCMKGRF